DLADRTPPSSGSRSHRRTTRCTHPVRSPEQPPRSPPEAAVAIGVVADRAQEVDLAQVGSESLHEVELAVRTLPQQEIAQPLLSAGADDQVGVRLPAGVQMLADH